jgi:hypothetical protein
VISPNFLLAIEWMTKIDVEHVDKNLIDEEYQHLEFSGVGFAETFVDALLDLDTSIIESRSFEGPRGEVVATGIFRLTYSVFGAAVTKRGETDSICFTPWMSDWEVVRELLCRQSCTLYLNLRPIHRECLRPGPVAADPMCDKDQIPVAASLQSI